MPRRSLLLTGPQRLSWAEEDFPPLAPDHVVVQTAAGAISVGSELPQYLGTARGLETLTYPRMTGYESLATVMARGRAVQHLRVGERVLAMYGHRTHAVLRSDRVISVPAGISDRLALLAILSCDAAKGIRTALGPEPDAASLQGPFLITGAGVMGLLTLHVLLALGAGEVDVVEPLPDRRDLAQHLGARRALAPDDLSPDPVYAAAFECSSRNSAFAQCQQGLRHEGRLGVIADGTLEPLILTPDFHRKELRIAASSDGWDYHRHAEWYFQQVSGGCPALEAIFELEILVADLVATFEHLASGEIDPVKILVRYGNKP